MQEGFLFSLDMRIRKIFPVHGFGSLKERERSCFTQREHIFTTDIRYIKSTFFFSGQNANIYMYPNKSDGLMLNYDHFFFCGR